MKLNNHPSAAPKMPLSRTVKTTPEFLKSAERVTQGDILAELRTNPTIYQKKDIYTISQIKYGSIYTSATLYEDRIDVFREVIRFIYRLALMDLIYIGNFSHLYYRRDDQDFIHIRLFDFENVISSPRNNFRIVLDCAHATNFFRTAFPDDGGGFQEYISDQQHRFQPPPSNDRPLEDAELSLLLYASLDAR